MTVGIAANPVLDKSPRSRPAALALVPGADEVSHNLNGQRLGRKGRDTRDRIIAATAELLEGDDFDSISLSAVARKASLGMTSIYNYFADLTELLLAVLEPVSASAEQAYLAMLRERWSDGELPERCFEFVLAYHGYWARHSRLLHLRNSMSDRLDARMMQHRVDSTQPIIRLLVEQMDSNADVVGSPAMSMAAMVMIGIERSVTIATDEHYPTMIGMVLGENDERFSRPGARLMELAIRDARAN